MKKLFILSLLLSCIIAFATNTSISDKKEVVYEHCTTFTFYRAETRNVISMDPSVEAYEVTVYIESSCTSCVALNGATRSNC